LDRAQRDQQQLWLQRPLVGPLVRDLSRPAGRGARPDDGRHRALSLAARAVARPHVDPAVPRRSERSGLRRARGAAMTRRIAVQSGLVAVLLGAIAWGVMHFGRLESDSLEASLRAAGAWAPLAFVLLYVAGTVL